jgi:rhodanese-related sulfurtransferase
MSQQIKTVDAATLQAWMAEGRAVVVDVREAEEWRGGHIPGAVSLPLSAFDPAKVPAEAGKHLVFHCQLGRRCGPASEMMVRAGYKGEINRLAGGFKSWREAGGAATAGA